MGKKQKAAETDGVQYRRAKLWQIILYACNALPGMGVYMLIGMANYSASIGYGIATAVVGVILTCTRILDGITDPFVAFLFDRINTKYGKIRILLVAGYVIEAIALLSMYSFASSKGFGIVVFTLLYVIYIFGYTITNITAQTIPAIMTNDPKQRPVIGVWTTAFNYFVPMILTIVLNSVMLPMFGGSYNQAFLTAAAFVCVGISGIGILLVCISVSAFDKPENLDGIGKKEPLRIRDMIGVLKYNKPLQAYIAAQASDKIAQQTVAQSVIVTMLYGIIIGNMTLATILSVVSMIPSIGFAVVGAKYAGKHGSKKAIVFWTEVCMVIAIVGYIFFVVIDPADIAVMGSIPMILYVLIMLAFNGAKMCVTTADTSFMADIIDYELDRSGRYVPAVITGTYSLIDKIISSFSALIATGAVALLGYTSTMPQPTDLCTAPIFWFTITLYFGMPFLGWVITLIAMRGCKLDREEMVAVQKRIEQKKEEQKMRKSVCINRDWTFEKEGAEERISLPHTWNAIDGQTGPDQYYRGECVYRKTFHRPELTDGEQLYAEFRGVNSSAKVLLNGTEVGAHDGGYSTFRVKLTDDLKAENTLEVRVDNLPNDHVYPQRADFTFYGGIYRDVYLLTVEETHFSVEEYGGNGFFATPHLNGKDASVTFETCISGKADRVVVTVEGVGETELSLTEVQGLCDAASVTQMGNGSMEIPDVHRWNGRKDPYLYTATATLYKNGQAVDQVTTRFGCREYHFDPEQGFFLNGESYPLHGVSRHQDRAGVGNALTKEMHGEDLNLILSMGANSIRLAHYQHDQYFYDLCDEKGLIVWAEIPYITVHMPNGRENTIQQMKELIVQNYNHASIICWAISNEVSLQGVTDDLLENHRILNDLIHKMDPSRVSAMANLFLLETDSPLVTLPDIRGYNLYYGWYVGEMEDNDAWFDEFHAKYPETVIGLTEYGADSVITLQSPRPEKGDFTEGYQALYHEHMLEMFSKRPYLWGTYCWNMFEFGAAGRDEAGDPGKNHKGLITFDRKQKKDAFYIYKAWWSDEPFVYLCGRRYHDRLEPVTEIKVYTNQKQVTLLVDGVEAETKTGEHIFRFAVPISGVHEIQAVVPGTSLTDTMEIEKVSEPNPAYFASKDKVKNWFDEETETSEETNGFFSIHDTMGEIQQTQEGAAILGQMMAQMKSQMAGGMGENAEIPQAMLAMIARQPLVKLLQQAGIDPKGETAQQLNAALSRIPKNR